jgi:methionine-rich copper-binding protein CopC
MKITNCFAGALLLSLATTAQGHTHLTASVPTEGSSVQSPEHIVLTFSEAARLTAMTLHREGETARKIAPLPVAAAAQVTIPMPKLAPGKYTLSWRVVGDDGHVMSATLHFTVQESSTAAASGS